MSQIFNESIESANFPSKLEYADIAPIYKKGAEMKNRIIDPLVLYLLYPKYSNVVFMIKSIKTLTIHCLDMKWAFERDAAVNIHRLRYFKIGRKNLDKGRKFVALFVDLSKAFDFLQHDLLLAELFSYEFDCKSLKLISSFLSNRKYKTKISSSFNEWDRLLIGVPQGSILGPLLFTICMCDLFLLMTESDVANYADDTTLYECEKKLSDVQRKL